MRISPSQKFHTCFASGAAAKPICMAYCSWGDPESERLLICVHGLTRQAHDFSVLASSLAEKGFFVVATDVVGRGESEWLEDPLLYQISTYVAHHLSLLSSLEARQCYDEIAWVGTSMGGLIGLGVCANAALGLAPRIDKLVLNDVGPRIETQGLLRLDEYIGKRMDFPDEDAAIAYLAEISSGFGPHTPAQWRALSLPMLRSKPEGGVRLHYDPRIADVFAYTRPEVQAQGEVALWRAFESVQAQIFLLRGVGSDILSRDTAEQMQALKPAMRTLEFAQVGHAPTLVHADQVNAVQHFLLRNGNQPDTAP